ncbi:MAG: methyltransferase domain-containing protein [Actinomycetota bacterium]
MGSEERNTAAPGSDAEPPPLYRDVDATQRNERLLDTMDATASWAAVRELRSWCEPAITAGDSLLDVGCGLAEESIRLATRHPALAVTGLDVSSEMIAMAQQRASGRSTAIELRVGDATALPFDDHEFDAVRSERMLQWLDQPESALHEMVRVAAPGGTIALIDTDWRTFVTSVGDGTAEQMLGGPSPTSSAGGRLRSWAHAAGLVNIESHAAVHHTHRVLGDGTDGLIPFDQFIELHTARGHAREAVEHYIAELRRHSADGTLSLSLTMWAVTATVPERARTD